MEKVEISQEKKSRFDLSEKSSKKDMLYKFGSLLGLIILCVILSIASPQFLTSSNLMNVFRQCTVNALIAVGMLMPILTGGIDLSVGSMLAFSTCFMGIAVISWGMNPILAMILSLIVGAILGMLNGLMLTKMHLPHPFISTLGMKNIARGLALVMTAASPISGFPQSIQYLGSKSVFGIPISFVLVIVVFIVFSIFLNKTAQGRYIYAVGGNKEAARLSGINVDKTLVLVYTICGFMAALAGVILVGRVNSASPLAGLDYDLDAIAACIIGGASFLGGKGNVSGVMIGVMIMAVLRNGLNLLGVSADIQNVAVGAVIIIAVYVDVLRMKASKKVKC
ncbi:ABC transporter permease [Clostridium sp.]|uniref:ABC transporter permease n=1 Tax=Clostridium sp. TaxID=1506 RepID=UPI0032169D02